MDILHRQFVAQRKQAKNQGKGLEVELVEAEKKRRQDMAALKRELYGEIMGPLASDPEWDDVVPIPQTETEGALAQIAYPEDYAEGN